MKTVQLAIKADPTDNIGYRTLGCLQLANNDKESAKNTWQKALKFRRTKAETELLNKWLSKLEKTE